MKKKNEQLNTLDNTLETLLYENQDNDDFQKLIDFLSVLLESYDGKNTYYKRLFSSYVLDRLNFFLTSGVVMVTIFLLVNELKLEDGTYYPEFVFISFVLWFMYATVNTFINYSWVELSRKTKNNAKIDVEAYLLNDELNPLLYSKDFSLKKLSGLLGLEKDNSELDEADDLEDRRVRLRVQALVGIADNAPENFAQHL